MIRALAIVALLAAPAGAEVCFSGPMAPRPVLGPKPRMSGSGGVIVAGNMLPDWRFRVLNKIERARVVTLAPGLAIYHPPPLPGDEVLLEDTDHQLIARVQRVFAIEPPLDPPDVTKIVTSTTGTYTRVTAVLGTKAPSAALVLIVSRVEGARTVPLAWAFTFEGLAEVVLWRTPYGCYDTVSTWVQPKAGERVVLTWVDDAGRLSEPSKPLTISEAANGK